MNIRLTEKALDRWRPGWRKRQVKRKSPWNLLCVLVGFGFIAIFWYSLFQVAWVWHVYLYPEHGGLKSQFWREGISSKAFASSFLMLMPLFIPAVVLGFLSANCLMWCIPMARRAMNFEAADDNKMTFAGSNAELIKWGGLASAICVILSVIGIVTLKSLK